MGLNDNRVGHHRFPLDGIYHLFSPRVALIFAVEAPAWPL
jgi:hypothetical protein